MSLVAYDASSDEEDAGEPAAAAPASPPPFPSSIGPQPRPPSPPPPVGASRQPPAPLPAPRQNLAYTSSSRASLPTPSLDLPDVAALFSSTSPSRGSAASIEDNLSRKRESNGSVFHGPQSKFPRVQSAQSRGARSTPGNVLVPPQLSGRSNVVTEDMSKLFVAKRKE